MRDFSEEDLSEQLIDREDLVVSGRVLCHGERRIALERLLHVYIGKL